MEQSSPARRALQIQVINWPTLLEQIRICPGMWLSGQSATALEHYTDGIKRAEEIHDIPADHCLGGFPWMQFEEWVDKNFNHERLSIRSFLIALNRSGAENTAFLLWFEWYDQFRRESGLI